MFSGIVEAKGHVAECNVSSNGARLTIETNLDTKDIRIGDSICVDGACLTAVSVIDGQISFEVVNETLRKTTLGKLVKNSSVNLERSLKVGDRIHGHVVSGHVDAVATVLEVKADGESKRLLIELPHQLRPYVTQKGSICISGISLTLGEVTDTSFSVYIIPHTSNVTTLGALVKGSEVNIEVDMLARYTESVLKAGRA